MGTPFQIQIRYEKLKDDKIIEPTIQLVSGLGEVFLVTSAAFTNRPKPQMPSGVYSAVCQIPGNLLNSGRFYLDLLFHQDQDKRAVFRMNRLLLFQISPPEQEFGRPYRRTSGPIRPLLDWEITPKT